MGNKYLYACELPISSKNDDGIHDARHGWNFIILFAKTSSETFITVYVINDVNFNTKTSLVTFIAVYC